MPDTTTITTRADALAALGDLTARERAAVRVLLALAWYDGELGCEQPTQDADERHAIGPSYARLALPPRTVTRPRVVRDSFFPNVVWRSHEDGTVRPHHAGHTNYPAAIYSITPERAAIIADLLARPTDQVEVDDA